MNNFKLIRINYKYCNYLRMFDNKVPYNEGIKELRPFIGVLIKTESSEYFAPLSSPKTKHLNMKNNIDFFKIDNGKLGIINFNNMIPVLPEDYNIINLNDSNDKYNIMLKKQLNFINKNKEKILRSVEKLYNYYLNDKLNFKIKSRCCNFQLLEEKCLEYQTNRDLKRFIMKREVKEQIIEYLNKRNLIRSKKQNQPKTEATEESSQSQENEEER